MVGDVGAAPVTDWTFMATAIEAAGNFVFELIMNSVRQICLPNAAVFAAVVSERDELAPQYTDAAEAIVAQDADSVVAMARYDDPALARTLGWDAEQVPARGGELRRAEGRP